MTPSETTRNDEQKEEKQMLTEYFHIVVFFGVAVALSLVIITLPKLLARDIPQKDKLKSYECGFDPFSDARGKFDVRFYLVAILFIIFDLEITFLIPWAISLGKIGYIGFWSMMVFLFLLIVGFVYEWKKGALEWE